MRALLCLLAVVLLAPASTSAVKRNYELQWRNPWRSPPGAPPASRLLDASGKPYGTLFGKLTLQTTGGTTKITQFTVQGPVALMGAFTVDLLEATDVQEGSFEAAVSFLDLESTRRIEFNPKKLLADPDRLDFVATLVPTFVTGGCITLTETEETPRVVRTEVPCDEARKDPELQVFEYPELEFADLHIVAAPAPEPAAVGMLVGVFGVLPGIRRARASGAL